MTLLQNEQKKRQKTEGANMREKLQVLRAVLALAVCRCGLAHTKVTDPLLHHKVTDPLLHRKVTVTDPLLRGQAADQVMQDWRHTVMFSVQSATSR